MEWCPTGYYITTQRDGNRFQTDVRATAPPDFVLTARPAQGPVEFDLFDSREVRGTILRLETSSVDQVECQVEYQVEHQVDRSFLHFGPSLTFLDLTLQSASLTDFDITQP